MENAELQHMFGLGKNEHGKFAAFAYASKRLNLPMTPDEVVVAETLEALIEELPGAERIKIGAGVQFFEGIMDESMRYYNKILKEYDIPIERYRALRATHLHAVLRSEFAYLVKDNLLNNYITGSHDLHKFNRETVINDKDMIYGFATSPISKEILIASSRSTSRPSYHQPHSLV
jgi:hypothetical protein